MCACACMCVCMFVRYSSVASMYTLPHVLMEAHLIYLFSGVMGVEDTIESEEFWSTIFQLWFPQLHLTYLCVHVQNHLETQW